MKNLPTIETKYTNFFNQLSEKIDIDFNNFLNSEEHTTLEEITDALHDNNAFDQEVIYYATAIKYLQENDPSLSESMEIANEYGFTLVNLNSEVLASLLKTQNVQNEFSELETEIEDFLSELFG
jgi:intracellular sulfur oxidation DsrE/DsrF family protein